MITDPEMALVYARALVAVARGDHEISVEEAAVLQARLAARCGEAVALDDVLLARRLDPGELMVGHGDGPFRSTAVDPRALALMLVEDGLAIIDAKGGGTSGEIATLRHFASALGLTAEELRQLA
jgi:hypothetical protein